MIINRNIYTFTFLTLSFSKEPDLMYICTTAHHLYCVLSAFLLRSRFDAHYEVLNMTFENECGRSLY